METLLTWLIVVTAALLMAYRRAPLWLWTTAAAFTLLWFSYSATPLTQAAIWSIFLIPALLLNISSLRIRWFTRPLLNSFRAVTPPMSSTERDALEAGTVGWDAELFSGKPNWDELLEQPTPRLSDDEQAFLDGPVEELCHRLDDWQITEKLHDLPPNTWRFIKEHGFFGMIIPRQYGGLGFSALAHSSVVMKIATRSITAAVTVMVPNSLGPAELLLNYGTRQQKDHYLPRLANGTEIPCFALTAPNAGSDAAAMTDSGIVTHGHFEGKEVLGLGIRLNWNKRYITLGPVATLLGLAFKLYDPERLLGGPAEYGITCALIPTRTPGITIGRRHAPLNQCFQNGPNQGRNVFIPLDWIIGGPAQAGKGWRMLMESLAAGRSISLPALSTGAGKLVSRTVGAYARVRTQFNTPIGHFEGVEAALARIAGHSYTMDAARVMTCGFLDRGEHPSVISAMVKYHLTEQMRHVVDDGMDVLGGRGIMMGPANFLGRVYQAVPISITVEGANILTRGLIIFGQGALRCHPWLLKEIEAANSSDPVLAEIDFDSAISGHIKHLLALLASAPLQAISGGRLGNSPGGVARRYYQQLNRLSSGFALTAELALLTLGGELKRKEHLSSLLGDILSHLYLASSALKQFEDHGQPEEELPLLAWSMEQNLSNAGRALESVLANFPHRPLAWLLRGMVLPFGNPWGGANHHLIHQVARLIMSPSATRDRLTTGLYLPTAAHEPLARLERSFTRAMTCEALEKRLHKAIRSGQINAINRTGQLRQAVAHGVLNDHESVQLRRADQALQAAIDVDDFPTDYWEEQNHGKETAA